jgi:glycerophosphoryl diester phosphodiesterase
MAAVHPTRRSVPAAALLGAAIVLPACHSPPDEQAIRTGRPSDLPAFGIAAHRGASASRPENTISAFREAARLGAHQIELDIRATADGQLVVIHDATVDRTTSGRGLVSELTLDQIRELDAGSWKGARFRGERVPTLVEALRAMPRNVWLNLHVKGEPSIAEAVARVVVEEDRIDQAVLAVDAEGARLARQVHPELWICALARKLTRSEHFDSALEMRADFIQLTSADGIPSREDVDRAKRAGLRVNYCCEEDPTRLPGLFALGIDFPMLDDVEGAMRAARRLDVPPPAPLEPIPPASR